MVAEIEIKLENSVIQQMRSDVPLGSFLSGGIDSSLISYLMQKNSLKKINTFNVAFEEDVFDESIYAREVSKIIGSNHHEIKLDYNMALETIPNMGYIFDEPFSDSSQIPTYLISSEIKKNVTVALSGDGGDELFGGYNRYSSISSINNFTKILPNKIKNFVSKLIYFIGEKNLDGFNNLILSKVSNKYSYNNFGHKMFRFAERISNFDNEIEIYKSFLSENSASDQIVYGSKNIDIIQEIIDENNLKNIDFTNFMMLIDSKMYLPDDILVKVDRSSMSNSLESRAPFLNKDLVELSYQIPSSMKIVNNNKKFLLKKLLYKNFDPNLFDRPKAGFAIPLSQWLRGPLKSLLFDSVNSLKKSNLDILNFNLIDKKCLEHIEGKKNWDNFLWSIIIFNNWYEINQ